MDNYNIAVVEGTRTVVAGSHNIAVAGAAGRYIVAVVVGDNHNTAVVEGTRIVVAGSHNIAVAGDSRKWALDSHTVASHLAAMWQSGSNNNRAAGRRPASGNNP